ncbi:hypothetical protein Srubr_76990 [Streptomyces rubradiris]|uniref:MFS transporter n=1 Tax=Streptomyces rubradiris TaxID=285531 RepID=A0ABQ3RPQ7_STRRR|nr:hypothetical protein GCM10018792_49520 [Streptomyces rubradiris]GHI57853.1 hypothetical protein Srubr_76990 [Streptomyces rubradiris]
MLGPSLLTSLGAGLVPAPAAAAATTGIRPEEAGTASGVLDSARQLGGCLGLAVLATVAARRTGAAADPTAGYALGLAVSAGLFVPAAAVAIGVLPRRGPTAPGEVRQPAVRAGNRLEGTPT